MDLNKIYSLRQKFTIIAMTGRAGSGCTSIAKKLGFGFQNDPDIYPHPDEIQYSHNSFRKYRIIYEYTSKNFTPFKVISYKDIIVAFILKYPLTELCNFLNSRQLKTEFKKSNLKTSSNFKKEIEDLKKESILFNRLHKKAEKLIIDNKKSDQELKELFSFFESFDFKKLSSQIHAILSSESLIKRNKTLQEISNNQRGFGHPYVKIKFSLKNIFSIAEVINDLIKSIRNSNGDNNTEIVIDSLRNPFEIMFFKQRYSAFYTMAINRKDVKRKYELNKRVKKHEIEDMNILLEEEHSEALVSDFHKQHVSFCIQNADIHITYTSKREADKANRIMKIKNEISSPYFTYGMQLLKFLALIDNPGMITPSPEERCMQIAYTAKYNSGCISRQVGAAITDENYSLKAIGWNNTPEGQVPCILRNVKDLINNEKDIVAFTPYEKENLVFKKVLLSNYKNRIKKFDKDLKGRNVCYCFKSIINSFAEGKNQVHTRSLHAEENAFLQISKYGGTGIINGKLFATASPCELCSKKAYQLGIKVIYYIDPYPGISKEHILAAGPRRSNPVIRLFSGAIGNAYHWLYEPIMPYKDELSLILEHEIKDLTKKLKYENDKLKKDNRRLNVKIGKLTSNNK
jgi:deoxycytidylate deaminase